MPETVTESLGVIRSFRKGRTALAVTIDELAALANTSTATVSRVLNNKPGVAEPTRKRVMALAEKLSYHPNRIAQNLARQKSHLLGLIAADLTNAFYIHFLRWVQQRFEPMGYQVLTADSEQDSAREKHHINVMLQHRAEGLIVFPVADWHSRIGIDHLMELRLRRYPFVTVGKLEGFGCDSVTTEEVEAAYTLAHNLTGLGHRRVAFVGFDAENRPVRERFEGVRRALREVGTDFAAGMVIELGDGLSWLGELEKLLAGTEKPSAIVFINDVLAMRAQRAIIESGLKVPDDLSVVTFGNALWTANLKPSLTTTEENLEEVARVAMDLLFERMKDPDRPTTEVLIPQRIIYRESTAPCPK